MRNGTRVGLLTTMKTSWLWFFMGLISLAGADDWPQWLGPERDGVWREQGVLDEFPKDGPKVMWRVPIASGYAGPAVSDGRVFLMDRILREETSDAPGFAVTERLHCLDEATGETLWRHTYDTRYTAAYPAGPRATPTVDADRVYILGTEGDLKCLKVATGEVVWAKDFKKLFGVKTPRWGFAGAPLVDGDLLICLAGGEGTTAVAFDKMTGAERWRALSAKEPGYFAPCIIEYGTNRQLILWHAESINALDPTTGDLHWSLPWDTRAALTIPMPRLSADGETLFFTSFYLGSRMLKLQADGSQPEILWETEKPSEKRTTHLNSIISTPVLADGHIYGVCSYGQFRCLRMDTGERVWEDKSIATGGPEYRWGNAFITPHKDRYFIFNELGDLLIARLSPEGPEILSRAHVIEPNGSDIRQRPVVWTQPAYANRKAFIRNDTELVCLDLSE